MQQIIRCDGRQTRQPIATCSIKPLLVFHIIGDGVKENKCRVSLRHQIVILRGCAGTEGVVGLGPRSVLARAEKSNRIQELAESQNVVGTELVGGSVTRRRRPRGMERRHRIEDRNIELHVGIWLLKDLRRRIEASRTGY